MEHVKLFNLASQISESMRLLPSRQSMKRVLKKHTINMACPFLLHIKIKMTQYAWVH